MAHYTIVDLSHLFARARFVAQGDGFTKAGMTLLILFRALRRVHQMQHTDHVVIAVDHGSWRSKVYPPYKQNRRAKQLALTEGQREEAAVLAETRTALVAFLHAQTRCTVLDSPDIEADDFVARWVQRHPADQHVVVASDSDFVQLLAPNVRIYDGVAERWLTTEAVTNLHGERLAFTLDTTRAKIKTTGVDPEFQPEPEWWRKQLFLKIIRGDPGDGIFGAYPGVRYNGSSKRVGIAQAWADRHARGYDWNNFFGQTWNKLHWQAGQQDAGTAHPVRVLDEYRINEQLIDLTCQPAEVKARMDAAIDAAATQPLATEIGPNFKKFCATHDLPALAREAFDHVVYLNAADPRRGG